MEVQTILMIAALMALAAALYTAVGHAGASAYLAIMALFALPPEVMRPTALVLNIIVASLAAYRYVRAGQFNGKLLLPFVLAAIPAAFLAGRVHLPPEIYRPVVGVVLWVAALRLFFPAGVKALAEPKSPPLWAGLGTGAGVGALSGLTGTGGGIFLSPLILLNGWESPRKTSGVAAVFILCVSLAGLAGQLFSVGKLPHELPVYAGAVLIGALAGTWLGVSRLPSPRILQALAVVLVIAGAKLIFT
ncbi:MAG: sulfite exporter TauE/SafE family protein [Caulobacteraceae bacterium]